MDIPTILETLRQNIIQTSYIEIIAVFFGLISVWFAKKENIWVYPTGILNVLIYVYIFFIAKLYALAAINVFYFATSVYGWYNWTHGGTGNDKLSISVCSRKMLIIDSAIVIVSTGILWVVLKYWIANSSIPFWDSFTTAIFLVGMLLMAKKKVDNWTFWIIGDALCVPMCIYQGLIFTAFQYIVFLWIAIAAYVEWNKKYKQSLQHA